MGTAWPHKKSIYLLNIEGYWDPLVSLIKHQVNAGFADASLLKLFKVVTTTDGLLTDL